MRKNITCSRLVLGTVQLGLPYGIANRSGQPDLPTAIRVVRAAWEGGIRLFDTASAYGESEIVLGTALRKLEIAEEARIVSKLPPSLTAASTRCIKDMAGASLELLGVPALYGLMLHREEHLSLLDGPLGDVLQDLLAAGIARKLGVSVYSPAAAIRALRHPLVKLLQLPASLFDRRFEAAGVFTLADELGKEIHVRSALLQGVLCMEPGSLPERLAPLAPALAAFSSLCAEYALLPASLALVWLLRRYPQAFVLFGAETPEQVRQNLDMLETAHSLFPALEAALEAIKPPQTDNLLNPATWSIS